MAEDPTRGTQLRTPVPTLEPDDAFVARLSQLAAASASGSPEHRTPTSYAGWRVVLAAAAVAAVLVGVAWLAGLRPGSRAEPAHQPTPAPGRTSAPQPGPGDSSTGSDPAAAPRLHSTRGASSPGGEGRGDGHHGLAGVGPAGGLAGQPIGEQTGQQPSGPGGPGAGQQPGHPGVDGDSRDEHAQGQLHANPHAGQHPSVGGGHGAESLRASHGGPPGRSSQSAEGTHGGPGGPGRDGQPGIVPGVISTSVPGLGRPVGAGQRG